MAFFSKAASLLKFTVPSLDFPWITTPTLTETDATSIPGDDDNPRPTETQAQQEQNSQSQANKDDNLPRIPESSEKQMAVLSKARKYVPTDSVLLPLLTWTQIVEECVRCWEDTGPETNCEVFAGKEDYIQNQEARKAVKEQPISQGSTPAEGHKSRLSPIDHDWDSRSDPRDGLTTPNAKFTDVSDHIQAGEVPDSIDKLTELGNEDGKGDASDLEKPADTLSNSYAGNGGNSVCGSPQPSLTLTESGQNQDDIPIRRDSLTSEPFSKLGHGASASKGDKEFLRTSKEDVSISYL